MKLSGPIFQLKRRAKLLSRIERIPLNEALDRVASGEGFRNWSLLAAQYADRSPAYDIVEQLQPGDFMLLGARPMQGKTRMALHILAEAHKAGHAAWLFTLEHTDAEVRELLRSVKLRPSDISFDTSDAICAEHIIARMQGAAPGAVVAVDYLQILDQQREKPPLAEQIVALKAFAVARGLIFVFISQIDRAYDAAMKALPDVDDVCLPNKLDTSLFTKTCFLSEGRMAFSAPPTQ